jgi:hypothetical protein
MWPLDSKGHHIRKYECMNVKNERKNERKASPIVNFDFFFFQVLNQGHIVYSVVIVYIHAHCLRQ